MKALSATIVPVAVGLMGWVTLTPVSAHAQLEQKLKRTYGGAFEVKAGPFLPALARSVADGGSAAWNDLYGADRSRVLVSFGADLQVYRSQWVTAFVGGTVGYVRWSGDLPVPDGGVLAPGEAGSSTFTLVPMTFTAGARFDYLMQRTPIPLAPYARGGLAYHLWWNSQPLGDNDNPSGGRLGAVGTFGLAFPLNVIDRSSADNLRTGVGVRTTYAFIEAQISVVDGFGNGDLDLSDTTWLAGMAAEF